MQVAGICIEITNLASGNRGISSARSRRRQIYYFLLGTRFKAWNYCFYLHERNLKQLLKWKSPDWCVGTDFSLNFVIYFIEDNCSKVFNYSFLFMVTNEKLTIIYKIYKTTILLILIIVKVLLFPQPIWTCTDII